MPYQPYVTSEIASKFCGLSNWAYQCWLLHRVLFDTNNRSSHNIGRAKGFFVDLSIITQEYALLQLVKLHDPWKQFASQNLSIEFVVRGGNWGNDRVEIEHLASELEGLFHTLKPARNKILSHNDLETLLKDQTIGAFEDGIDVIYFRNLQTLVNKVHERWCGKPFPFVDQAKANVLELLRLLEKTRK